MTRSIMWVAMVAVIAATGSIIMINEYTNSNGDMSDLLTVQHATAQLQTLFKPGQVIYLSDAAIDRMLENPPFPSQRPFNMETGNSARQVIVPYLAVWLHQEVTPHFSDPTLSFRYVTLSLNAGYDATAPYHETAVGVYSRINNLPASYYENYKDMNIASIHASYQLFKAFDPGRIAQWNLMLTTNGLNPNHEQGLDLDCNEIQSLTDPVAIGNFAGKCVLEGRHNDGFNHFGDETNGYPFMDTTGYVPVNSANQLVNPSKWQPLILRNGEGEYVTQQFVTPQWADTRPYSDFDPRSIRTDIPVRSDHTNVEAYTTQADEVLMAVENLNDRQKIIAEYFDNKARGTIFSPPLKQIASPQEFWQLDFLLHFAEFDAGIVAWQEKARHDAVRPITAIQYLYGDEMLRTFDDKNPDTPRTIPGNLWEPYLYTSNHPEYPSATACFCAAEARAWKLYNQDKYDVPANSDAIPVIRGEPGFSGILRQGSSIHETGMTPASDVYISYATWDEYVRDCGDSRVWTGVHFQDAVDESIEVCADVGDKAYAYFQSLLDGTAPIRGVDHKLLSDTGVIPSELRICR